MDHKQWFVLDFSYVGEPLHIILAAAKGYRVCEQASELVKPILDLFNEGLIELQVYDDDGERIYVRKAMLSEDELALQISKEDRYDETSWPPGVSYDFETTDKGRKLVDESEISDYYLRALD